jgi:hypothetical protein
MFSDAHDLTPPVGVILNVVPTNDIMEFSTMVKPLCMELIDLGEGLERDVFVDLQYITSEGFDTSGMRKK